MADLDLRIFNNWVFGDSKELLENTTEIVSPNAGFVYNNSLPRLSYAPRYLKLL